MIESTNPHVVIGTESWLDNTISDSEMFPSGYTVYRKDRNCHGGGVFVLIQDSIASNSISIEADSCETVWCKILLQNGSSVAIGSFYRPPGIRTAHPLFQLSNVLLSLQTTHVILGGDFNFPDVEWKSFKPVLNTTFFLYTTFREMINAHSLFQFVEAPTRIGGDSANILDLFLCSEPDLVSSVVTVPGISDHEVVVTKMSCSAKNRRAQAPRKVFSYEKGDYPSLSRELDAFFPEFQSHSSSLDMNAQWNFFKTKIMSLTQTFIPSCIISARRRNDKPWLSRELRSKINRKNRLYRKYCQVPDPALLSKMKEIGKMVTKAMRRAQEMYLCDLGEKLKTNPKEVWKYVKNKSNSRPTIPDIMDGINYESNTEAKAQGFNTYFQSVFSHPVNTCSLCQNDGSLPQMNDIEISERGVVLLLEKINVHSAPGPDCISNFVLKNCAVSIAPFLTLMYKTSLEQCVLPADWKNANVIPVYKSGDKTKKCNYRPISLTSVCCKTLENIIYTNLMNHLQSNNFFSPLQHGFRAGFSCDTQLVEFTHDIAASINSGLQVDCIFLDFQKAFDSVSHVLLLQKLHCLGIPNALLMWIEAYLSERQQCVILDGVCSSSVGVLSGVPQGSVLGPLLFLIFINDISDNLSSRVRLYADDCCIYSNITSEADTVQLQNDLNSIVSWCDSWRMTLNLSKCKLVRFTNKKQPRISNYVMAGATLPVETEYKYLGVIFSANLSWNAHINYLTLKASRVLNFLRRNFRQAPTKLKETLYISNVRPILEYACSAWDPSTKSNIEALERVQARAARFVASNYNFTIRSADIRSGLQWPLLADRRKYLRLSLFYSIFMNKTGIDKDQYIRPPTYVSPRTDHSLKLREYTSRINAFKYAFFPRTTHEWNGLPEEIVSAPPLSFVKNLHNFLLN